MKLLKNKLENKFSSILNEEDLNFIERETDAILDPNINISNEEYEK